MSCLTRQLQQKLARYIQTQLNLDASCEPSVVRDVLINRGVCPCSVTEGQVRQILQVAGLK